MRVLPCKYDAYLAVRTKGSPALLGEGFNAEQPIDLIATNLAAHEIPDEWRDDREGWISTLTETILPQLPADAKG